MKEHSKRIDQITDQYFQLITSCTKTEALSEISDSITEAERQPFLPTDMELWRQKTRIDTGDNEDALSIRGRLRRDLDFYLNLVPIGQSGSNSVTQKLRKQLFYDRGEACEACTEKIELKHSRIHHLNYYKGDNPEFLRVLCVPCHEIVGKLTGLINWFQIYDKKPEWKVLKTVLELNDNKQSSYLYPDKKHTTVFLHKEDGVLMTGRHPFAKHGGRNYLRREVEISKERRDEITFNFFSDCICLTGTPTTQGLLHREITFRDEKIYLNRYNPLSEDFHSNTHIIQDPLILGDYEMLRHALAVTDYAARLLFIEKQEAREQEEKSRNIDWYKKQIQEELGFVVDGWEQGIIEHERENTLNQLLISLKPLSSYSLPKDFQDQECTYIY